MDILKACQFDTYRTRKDGSVVLCFETGEVTATEVAVLHTLRNSVGIVAFSRRESMSAKEIKEIESIDAEIDSKSKSERLRNVLYVLFQQQPEGYTDFKQFYADRMERIIQQIKTRLEP